MIYFLIYFTLTVLGYVVFSKISLKERIIGFGRYTRRISPQKLIKLVCMIVYVISLFIFSAFINSFLIVLTISIMPVIVVYAVMDIISRMIKDRERKQITFFIMTMSKWSSIKNDLIYCLKKTSESKMKKPMGAIVENVIGRIYSGMTPKNAIELMEKEARSDDLKYLASNIRFAAEKGGNLSQLFKSMEEQYFRVDEEYYKRKISTLRDRIVVYMTILIVAIGGTWYVTQNVAARDFYLTTTNGNLFLMIFTLIFGAGVLVMLKGDL